MKFIKGYLFGEENQENEELNSEGLSQEEVAKVSPLSIFLDIKEKRDLSDHLKEYIEQNKDINQAYNSFGKTFLHFAVEKQNYEAIRVLIEHGAISQGSSTLGHPLHVAVRKADSQAVETLFTAHLAGKDGEERAREAKKMQESIDPKSGLMVGMAAILSGNKEVIEKVSQFSPLTHQYTLNNKIYSAYDIAAQSPNPAAYYQVAEKDPEFHLIKTEDCLGKNCLDYAIENNNLEALKYLLRHEQINQYPERTLGSLLNGLDQQSNGNQELVDLIQEKKAFLLEWNKKDIPVEDVHKESLVNLNVILEMPRNDEIISEENYRGSSDEEDISAFPAFHVPEHDEVKIVEERERLNAKKRDLLKVARDDVVDFVDKERAEKIEKLEKNKLLGQIGNEGREDIARNIDELVKARKANSKQNKEIENAETLPFAERIKKFNKGSAKDGVSK